MKKIVLSCFREENWKEFERDFPTATFLTEDQIDQADALVPLYGGAFHDVFPKIEKAPHLVWVHTPCAGVEEYLTPTFKENKTILTNGRVFQSPEVSDHAMALLLAMTRNIHRTLRNQDPRNPIPVELRNKKALVVGCGGIGLLIAEKLNAFGMHVYIVDDKYAVKPSFVREQYYPHQLQEVIQDKDVVVCASPLTPTTKHMFNDTIFGAMKEQSYFVNISRGGLVDTTALTAHVDKFAGVGLDVTEPEPLPEDHPLFCKENVLITGHLAGISDQHRPRGYQLMKENVRRYIAGEPLLNVVDKKRGF